MGVRTSCAFAIGQELLRQKLAPPVLSERLLDRTRVVELGAKILSERGVLGVFACAGAGKTVAIHQLARSIDRPAAWVNFDDRDCDARRVLGYLTAALDCRGNRILAGVDDCTPADAKEMAAVLAQGVSDEPLLIVLDNCEHIAGATHTCDLIRCFIENLPNSVTVILSGRRRPGGALHRLDLAGRVGWIGDSDLALTVDELDSWTRFSGKDADEIAELWTISRGWIAPMALHGHHPWRSSGDFRTALYRYMSDSLLGPLTPNQQQLLLDTSVLDSVPREAMQFLCTAEVAEEFGSVAELPLPMFQTSGELIYHPIFRDFLRDRLWARSSAGGRERQQRQVSWLLHDGQIRDAIDVLLQIGDLDAAATTLEEHVETLLERAEWHDILRFVKVLGIDIVRDRPFVLAAQIRSLRGVFRFDDARSLIRDLESEGRLDAVVGADPGVLPYAAGSLLWKPSYAMSLLDRYDVGARAAGVRYMLRAMADSSPVDPPSDLTWTGRRSISWGLMVQGRLRDLVATLPAQSEWPPTDPYTTPHGLLGLLWRGEVVRTRELFDQVPASVRLRIRGDMWLCLEALLLLAEEEPEAALAAADEVVSQSRHTGIGGHRPAFQNVQARALLALGRVREAKDILADAVACSEESGLLAYVEWNLAVLGQVHLLCGNDAAALRSLRDAVASMSRSQRLLLLPMAAGFLSEAEWRAGNEDAADRAAALAFETSERIGAFTALQIAVRQFPSVLHRQIDLNQHAGWREIVTSPPPRPRLVSRVATPAVLSVEIRPFGPNADIFVGGQAKGVRRIKVLELAALITHKGTVRRDTALASMFPESDRQRGTNYLRQLLFQMRNTTGLSVERTKDLSLTWPKDARVTSTDLLFENALIEARCVQGEERLARLQTALRPINGGYLPTSELEWVSTRRYRLELLEEEAVVEVADLAFKLADYDTAREFSERALVRNPYNQDAYRTLVRVETTVGTKTAAVAVYRRAVSAVGEIGLDVAPDIAFLINSASA